MKCVSMYNMYINTCRYCVLSRMYITMYVCMIFLFSQKKEVCIRWLPCTTRNNISSPDVIAAVLSSATHLMPLTLHVDRGLQYTERSKKASIMPPTLPRRQI